MTSTHNTREEWLLAAIEALRPAFVDCGEDFGQPRVSLGFSPGGRSLQTVGSCWSKEASADNTTEIFISPTLTTTTGPEGILAVLVHELIHASGYMDHKAGFRRLALRLGLQGKMTATVAGPDLCQRLDVINDTLGTYPGSHLNPNTRKKQTTRLIKLECHSCGFIARASRSALNKAGYPTCGCGQPMI